MEQLFKVEAQIDGPEGIDVDKVSFRVLRYGFRFGSLNTTCVLPEGPHAVPAQLGNLIDPEASPV